jgi:tetratricopeptide (TPR) repeat protein
VQPSAVPASLTPPPVQSRTPGTLQKTKEQWKKEGDTHYNAKRYQEALAAYEHAIRLDPNDAGTHLNINRGNTLHHLQRYQEALAAYEHATLLDPNYAGAYLNKGIILEKLGEKREAKRAYERARQLGYNG